MMQLNKQKLERLIRDNPRMLDNMLREVSIDMVSDIKASMGTSPPGERYSLGTGRFHVASIRGYPPNVDTGQLRNSITQTKIKRLHYRISDGVEYGIWLEAGTPHIMPRPFIGPVFKQWRKKLQDRIREVY